MPQKFVTKTPIVITTDTVVPAGSYDPYAGSLASGGPHSGPQARGTTKIQLPSAAVGTRLVVDSITFRLSLSCTIETYGSGPPNLTGHNWYFLLWMEDSNNNLVDIFYDQVAEVSPTVANSGGVSGTPSADTLTGFVDQPTFKNYTPPLILDANLGLTFKWALYWADSNGTGMVVKPALDSNPALSNIFVRGVQYGEHEKIE